MSDDDPRHGALLHLLLKLYKLGVGEPEGDRGLQNIARMVQRVSLWREEEFHIGIYLVPSAAKR